MKFLSLASWNGTIERGTYAAISIALMFVKYNLDRLIAGVVFKRSWYFWNYFVPGDALAANQMPQDAWRFYFVLAAVAAPFAWIGVCLTIRRLRSAGLSPWLIVFFFLPLVNLLLFLVLCFVPTEIASERRGGSFGISLRRYLPDHPAGSAAVSILLVSPISVVLVKFGVEVLGRYGWGLFIGIPFVLGFCSVLLYGVHRPRSFGSCMLVSFLSVVLAGLVLLAIAVEGVICLLMAFPIAVPAALAGGAIAFGLQRGSWSTRPPCYACSLLPLALPLLMTIENAESGPPTLLQVSTEVVINAPPEQVWPRVISFSEIPAPTEWLFKTGIAYPTHAKIYGHGVGAIRHCVFSTGAFVEPISTWDESHVLAFSVTEQPPPMQELSPYRGIQPPHLDNYLVSERGELRLEKLAGNRTLLRGTTWYRHAIWPAPYWRIWSDYLIHHIHLRVLNHIKTLSETAMH
ncbi:MAG: hypothetical protein QOD99_2327 [Chthoniobacter sp.]|jgi:uncharacterized membrane protein YhaH (DUF805 family)|nr:hypothetical protein [Chthoniobacter sp.]